MLHAGEKVREALADVGYAPRSAGISVWWKRTAINVI